jgi:hypothetical protein
MGRARIASVLLQSGDFVAAGTYTAVVTGGKQTVQSEAVEVEGGGR